MPIITISGHWAGEPRDLTARLLSLSKAFATEVAIAEEHVIVTWLEVGVSCRVVAGAVTQSALQVELLTPDFNSAARIESMLYALAATLSEHFAYPPQAIFIHHQCARSGQVYDGGEIARW